MSIEDIKRQISLENFKRIQGLSEPLVDSLDSKLKEIIEFYEAHQTKCKNKKPQLPQEPAQNVFDALNAPDLTHTKLLSTVVNGRALRAPSWNSLLDEVVVNAAKQMDDFETLTANTLANVVRGQKTDEGYHYLQEIDVSVQGQSANDAWRAAASLALQTGQGLEVRFVWREKKGAQRPGESGSFLIEGSW